ncbi:MAG TPA: dockerin type I repeat-containing protein [bacterium]|nr:dockerin type I repeat-containing protein [bacterium]HOL35086.1 dockerin type I repeat-containing protein [bacterium]HPP07867.1 dockerin type I repeat-containing protein [bacterium]
MLSPGSQGIVLDNPYNCICKLLDGKNWIWWYVSIKNMKDGQVYTGWCSEHRLKKRKGDVNEDGVIDISDAILCLRMSIGLDPMNIETADMNSDGVVDISDAILILRKTVGLN